MENENKEMQLDTEQLKDVNGGKPPKVRTAYPEKPYVAKPGIMETTMEISIDEARYRF